MRNLAPFCLFPLALAACQASPEALEQDRPILELLEAGDSSICNVHEVQDSVIAIYAGEVGLSDNWDKRVAAGSRFAFDAVSMTDRKPEIDEVTCGANIMINRPHRITYKVRPTADRKANGFVVESETDNAQFLFFLTTELSEPASQQVDASTAIDGADSEMPATQEEAASEELSTENVVANDVDYVDDQSEGTESYNE